MFASSWHCRHVDVHAATAITCLLRTCSPLFFLRHAACAAYTQMLTASQGLHLLHMQLDNPNPARATSIRMALEARIPTDHWMVRCMSLSLLYSGVMYDAACHLTLAKSETRTRGCCCMGLTSKPL